MKKQLGLLLALSMVSGLAFAAPQSGTIGLGVAHSFDTLGDSNYIFVPITLNNGLWVEPFIAFNRDVDHNAHNNTTALSIGAGIFENFHETEKTAAYLGLRGGYNHYHVHPGHDSDGFLLQPTLGFGYMPVQPIMLGAEAYVTYQDATNENGIKNWGTGTRLFVRYYFTH
jgi:hypothetical protein